MKIQDGEDVDRPVETWKGYNLKEALSDLVSGLTVAFVRIPQGMAYAFLAGVQPQYGLYTGLDRFFIDQSTFNCSFLYSNAYAKLKKWIFNVEFPGNLFELGIVWNNFSSFTI